MDKQKVDAKTKRSIEAFLKTRGIDTGTLETGNEGAVLPDEVIAGYLQDIDKLDLSKDVRVVETTRGSGTYGILKKSNQKFKRVEELTKHELPTPKVIDMECEINTHRGTVPISSEMVDDADFDVVALLAEYLNELDINTKNAEIIAKMKTATPHTVTGAGEFKTFINKEITGMRNAKAYVSSSLFNELDKLKGENGAPLLQDDAAVSSGKRINGKVVEIIEDEQIGTAEGDLVGFFGDLHEFITLFDRKKDIIKWEDDNIYGLKLVGSVRFDTQVADTDAGFYVTYTPGV